MSKPTLSEIQSAIEDNIGFCTHCQTFTNDGVEPDARGYECDQCGNFTVMGTEQAIMEGVLS